MPTDPFEDWPEGYGTEPAGIRDFAPFEDDDEHLETLPLPVVLFKDIKPQLHGRALIKGVLMASAATVVFGLPGSAKSFLVLDWMLCLAAAIEKWFGHKVEPGPCLYIAAEGAIGVLKRVAAWRQELGLDGVSIPFGIIPQTVDLFDPKAGDLDKLRAVLAFYHSLWGRIAAVAFDTLNATIGDGEENSGDMGVYLRNVNALCEPYGCARIIVHHAPLSDNGTKRPRGHSSLWGAVDTAIYVEGDNKAPARKVVCTKQKDDEPFADIAFRLRQVEIGTDEDGDPVTSCIVEPSDIDPESLRRGRRLSDKQKITLAALERTIIETGQFPPSQIPDNVCDRARTGKVASMSGWRSAAMSALHTPDTQPDSARTAFNRARDALQAAEIVGIWEDWAWLA